MRKEKVRSRDSQWSPHRKRAISQRVIASLFIYQEVSSHTGYFFRWTRVRWSYCRRARTCRICSGGAFPKFSGSSLAELLGATEAADIVRGLKNPSLDRNPLYVGSFTATGQDGRPRVYNVIGHCHQGCLIAEFEAAIQDRSVSFQNLYPLVRTFMARLQDVNTVSELSHLAAEEVRRLTGFDRVLVYSFDPDWHGHVIAESETKRLPLTSTFGFLRPTSRRRRANSTG